MLRWSVGLLCTTMLWVSAVQAQEPAKPGNGLDPAVEKAVFQFLDAFLSWDTETVVEQAGYPFLLREKRRLLVLENKEQLRQHLARVKQRYAQEVERSKQLRWQHRVVQSFSYDFFMQRFGQRLPEPARRDLNRVLKKGDRIMLVRSIGRAGGAAAGSTRFVFVRIGEDKAVVVGRL